MSTFKVTKCKVFNSFEIELVPSSTSRPKRTQARFENTDPFLYVYTSGTTGLPKASKFSHLRFIASGSIQKRPIHE